MSKREIIFYDQEYLSVQGHKQLRMYEDENFKIIFSIKSKTAYSLPLGLFGSFLKKRRVTSFAEFDAFWKVVKTKLEEEGVHRIEVVHPSHIYRDFVAPEWLKEIGFSVMYDDINHHIPLSKFALHKMEERKLQALNENGFRAEHLTNEKLELVYSFLAECRKEKGLKINVPLQKLQSLIDRFPDTYDFFGGYLGDELACAAITLKTSEEVAYYFLPGTLEKYKKASPMVGLLDSIVQYYSKSKKYLDLGISSVEGEPQQGLITFKERMGGIQTPKRRYFVKI